MLDKLGLDPAAETIYRALLTDPHDGVPQLSRRLNLSETAVREALDRLADLQLLRASRDAPGTLRPVSPELGLELIVRQQELDLQRRQRELELSRAAAAAAIAEYGELRPNSPTETSERLVGMDAIEAKLEVLAAELTTECLSVMPGGAQSAASLDASRPLDESAIGRGVALLTLYQDSARNDPATHAYARWLTELGGLVRTCPTLPPRMVVFDRTVALVPIDPANSRLGALCTREPGIVSSLVALFERTWSDAIPLGIDRASDVDTGLNAMEKEVLSLLATGLTDEVAGRRLGVSSRSVRRQMAALMDRLGASSRFEAGLKAAQRGWL
ncbi:regulatory protein, luxR family [Actinokineospora alba]|uniref:Regulatory protein, luxR family n=1 Tax=Actinokineospora alba TaxID=504798 RepID=A0A1H0JY54_9PSEU|nr:helix-turn-helix transcriptional regulator [Actinokineospora alba]TDP68121.1 regulatory LuxR family protein [Actinokineospora alba]SDH92724.1 regulatory protein, luxR family [Actinokineospora alba]SDO48452.1 regulatory protein, luxR family [Actinokineospora alba]